MKEITGDLIQLAKDGEFDVIVHGCNCFNAMGAGIARQIAQELPEATDVDSLTIKGDKRKLGKITIASVDMAQTEFFVINAYTQYGYDPSKSPLDYDALKSAFEQISVLFNRPDTRIGYPMIGAGLGGGDWNRISSIIDVALDGADHTLVKFDG